jgi:hypothetical protein
VELRRALLLFAIVLAVAAIVSSIANPPERGDDGAAPTGDAGPATERDGLPPTSASAPPLTPQPKTVSFAATARPQTRKVEVGQPATVLVDVETAAQIDIPTLGLTDSAEPLTPALFEVLVTERGSHAIMAQPASSDAPPSKVGTLEVVPAP